MIKNNVRNSIKIMVAVTFALMVVVNALANILPINGINTGQVSDSYFNLFAPAGITFSIWGVIYLLLAAYTLYQIGLFQDKSAVSKDKLLEKIGLVFSISSLANTVWIFSWHYRYIIFSFLLMLVILACLIYINRLLKAENLEQRENMLIAVPFSVYFGWITVATIANATVLLVSLGWNRFGISEAIWTIVILLVGMLIGSVTLFRNRDFAYGLVLIWAYVGILIKHTSADGFANMYPSVVIAVVVSLAVFVLVELYVLLGRRNEK